VGVVLGIKLRASHVRLVLCPIYTSSPIVSAFNLVGLRVLI
jgi:hypothetical protein